MVRKTPTNFNAVLSTDFGHYEVEVEEKTVPEANTDNISSLSSSSPVPSSAFAFVEACPRNRKLSGHAVT